MCRVIEEAFFHQCGHVLIRDYSSIDENCDEVHQIITYHFLEKCPHKRANQPYTWQTRESGTVGRHKGTTIITNKLNPSQFSPMTPRQLWRRRFAYHGRYMTALRVVLIREYTKRYRDAAQAGKRDRELPFLIDGLTQPNYRPLSRSSDSHQLFTRIPLSVIQHTPAKDDTCRICWLSLLEAPNALDDENGGCTSRFPVQLPCGHVFGYDCVLQQFRRGMTRCAVCTQPYDVVTHEGVWDDMEMLPEMLDQYTEPVDSWLLAKLRFLWAGNSFLYAKVSFFITFLTVCYVLPEYRLALATIILWLSFNALVTVYQRYT